MPDYVIRKAVKEESAEIMALIKNIAEYEKMANAVILTTEQFEKDAFGSEKLFGCFVAEVSDANGETVLVGYALHYTVYSTFKGKSMYLEDIFVHPDYRGRGMGKALIKTVAKEAVSTGCHRLDFIVLKWNKPAKEFYERFKAENLSEKEGWQLYRMQNMDLQNFALS